MRRLTHSPIADQVAAYEQIVDRYYRRDIDVAGPEAVNGRIHDFNAWLEGKNRELDTERVTLGSSMDAVRQIDKQIEAFDMRLQRQPTLQDGPAVRAYNDLVARRNALVERQRELVGRYEEQKKRYDSLMAEVKAEVARRGRVLDAAKSSFEAERDAYRRWTEEKQDLSFFRDLNLFYARLGTSSSGKANASESQDARARLREIRRALGQAAVRLQEASKNGLVIVPATLDGREEGYFVVDSGASLVTVPPFLIDALGLSGKLGQEIILSLAGGVRVKSRAVVIPRITVLGVEARDVEAVVLDESAVGVDGLLGHSFLDRFSYRIGGNGAKLVLAPKK